MQCLAALAEEEAEQSAWRIYMADMSRAVIHGMSRGKSTAPWWRDIISPKPRTEQTGQEIFDSIIRKALKRGETK